MTARRRTSLCLALLAVALPGVSPLPSARPAGAAARPFPAAGDVEVIPLHTGTTYRFKGLAVDDDGRRFFLGSWDRRQVVSVARQAPAPSVTELVHPFRGALNGMGVFLRDGRLYAVMNEVDDAPGGRPLSALVVFDAATGAALRTFTVRGDRSGRHHFNHVVVDRLGRAYVSDTLRGSLWSVDTRGPAGTPSPLLAHPALAMIHGITLDPGERRLYVTSYEEGLGVVDLASPAYRSLGRPDSRGNDGLAYHRGFLYGVGQNTLTRYELSADGGRVVGAEVLLEDHPYFNDPRCLDVVGDTLFVLANIEHAPVRFRSGAGRRDALSDTYVLRLPLP
jgi:hypothetical protein